MQHNKMVLDVVKEMDADDLLELIVLAKTGGCYERPLRARTVLRAKKHLEALIQNVNEIIPCRYKPN